jgi:hypothetical protein
VNKIAKTNGSLIFALIGSLAFSCGCCFADDTQSEAANERNIQRTRDALITAGDADSLAAAALLVGSAPSAPSVRLALFFRAVAAAPDRADLVWLNLQMCSLVESCDPGPLETRLHTLDPSNGAAWWVSIARSGSSDDAMAERKAIFAIANSEWFNVYWNKTILHTTRAVLKVRILDTRTALVSIIGSAAAMAIPPYRPISNACKGDNLKDPEFLSACQRVSSSLRRGDTYITEMIGVAIALRVWPEESPEFHDAVAARRLAWYRMETVSKTSIAQVDDNKSAERYLELLAKYRTEQDVLMAEIVDAGLMPTPPPDWTDKSGH